MDKRQIKEEEESFAERKKLSITLQSYLIIIKWIFNVKIGKLPLKRRKFQERLTNVLLNCLIFKINKITTLIVPRLI